MEKCEGVNDAKVTIKRKLLNKKYKNDYNMYIMQQLQQQQQH